MNENKRVIAMYLPQYHPFKENNEWWGKGFTEWRNVANAKPRFKGHHQPNIPRDLGFYDLRVPETREEQAQLAKENGIYGFCYYHYWFNGHQLMERPLNEVISSSKPDFPFMICWANENWTKRWDGRDNEVLIEQKYSHTDDIEHINYLLDNVFSDQRYIKVDGKPVFCVYRSTLLPNANETISTWRTEAKKKGIELYICRMESFGEKGEEYLIDGFDAAIEFQPTNYTINTPKQLINRISLKFFDKPFFSYIYDYENYVNFMINRDSVSYKCYPCVTPKWDNSPRRVGKTFTALINSTPSLYAKWLKEVYSNFIPYTSEENFVFINAWNEWAEGNYLEPDLENKDSYLHATKNSILGDDK